MLPIKSRANHYTMRVGIEAYISTHLYDVNQASID